MEKKRIHIPIMKDIILEHLAIQPTDIVVDGTLGFAGHGQALASELSKDGVFIGIDQDTDALAHSKPLFEPQHNAHIFHANYSDLSSCLSTLELRHFDKCLLDLGVSSFQFDVAERGFSHRFEAKLDMRMNKEQALSAIDVLNTYDKEQLSHIFYNYGELRHNKKLVESIIEARKQQPIETTNELQRLIKKSYYFYNKRSLYIKCCSQVFQAIRIEVNQEFEHLERFLESLVDITIPGSTIAIITFDSLEDKLVKTFVKQSDIFEACEKKVLKASKDERQKNPRSRSAKLRLFQRI